MQRRPQWLRQEAGSALLGTIVSAGILGFILLAASQTVTKLLSANRTMELRGDKESMRRVLLERISCSQTLTQSPTDVCKDGLIDLKGRAPDGSETVLISKTGTKYGAWTYRAECDAQNGVLVRATLPKSARAISSQNPTDFHPDPMTKKVVTWSDPSSLLFPQGTSLCGSMRSVRIVSGTYEGSCRAISWLLCNREQEIVLGSKPVQVQIYNVNNDLTLNLVPFNTIKFDTMNGNGGWQAVTNWAGNQVPQGPIAGYFYDGVKFTDRGFKVRKALNVEFRALPILNTTYHYIAYVQD